MNCVHFHFNVWPHQTHLIYEIAMVASQWIAWALSNQTRTANGFRIKWSEFSMNFVRFEQMKLYCQRRTARNRISMGMQCKEIEKFFSTESRSTRFLVCKCNDAFAIYLHNHPNDSFYDTFLCLTYRSLKLNAVGRLKVIKLWHRYKQMLAQCTQPLHKM